MTCSGPESPVALLASKRLFCPLIESVLFLLLFNVLAANAQDLAGLEQGIKPYGSYNGGDIDSISMVNGSLTLHIPLISFPQRGGRLHLGFSLFYNNPIYTLTNNTLPNGSCPSECYTWIMGSAANMYSGSGLSVVADIPSLGEVWMQPGGPGSCLAIENYTAVEPDGAVHLMGLTSSSNWISMDTTGYAAGGFAMADRQGTVYSYNGQTLQQGCGTFPSVLNRIQDVNGNYITPNIDPNNSNNILSYTDTMGRLIPNWPQTGASTSSCPTGTATSASIWSFPGPNGGTSQFLVCYAPFPISYKPDCPYGYSPCYGISGVSNQIQSIVLPNGTAWNFAFDTTGALSQITLPTGGTISYGPWGQDYHCFPEPIPPVVLQFNAYATTRTVNANDGTGPHTWQYALSPTAPGSYYGGGQTIVTDPYPYNNDAVHTLSAIGGSTSCSLYETELDQYSGSHTNGTLLKKTVTAYQVSGLYGSLAVSVAPTSIITTDVPANKSSKVTKSWDSGVALTGYNEAGLTAIYGDLLTESDYDFTGISPVRTTTNTYMALSPNAPNASSYLGYNLLDLPYTVQVSNSAGQIAYTTYGYDESTLTSSGVTEQHGLGDPYPGNQTSVHRWLNISTASTATCAAITNSYAVTTNVFYNTGEVQSITDPCGHPPTTYLYSGTYYGAYPTTVTNALGQSTIYGYDFNTGSVISIQDPNSQTTNKSYDMMDRLKQVSYPDNGSTKYCYSDVPTALGGTCPTPQPYQVIETKAITSSQNEISTAIVDGFGRLSQTQLNSDPSGTTYTKTTYDSVGRKSQVYNPTRCSSITTNCDSESTWGVTTYGYDPLNRVTSVTEQDGSVVQTTYDQTNANNTVVCTTVTDEALKSRQSCVDGLGRMTGVWEDPAGLNYETDYAYDALNNLLSATQNGNNPSNKRVRTFQYDSLSHLTQAANPESGTILYAYDADGNVITKTAPSPNQLPGGIKTVTTAYTYDKLNRLAQKSYSDGYTLNSPTPGASYAYDGSALTGCTIAPPGLTDSYPVGRRTSMCDGSGGTSWSHDTMGRILQERRTIGTARGDYENDAFNLDGSVASVTSLGYGVTYTYSGAARPLTAMHSATNLVTGATYAPPGELAGATLGSASNFTGFTVTNYYNDRLQPILLSATNSATGAAVFSDCFDFHLGVAITPTQTPPCSVAAYNPPANNGNVYQIANNRSSTRTQNFAYDSLNRILSGQSSGTGGTSWGDTYVIDAWGNLTNINPISGKAFGQNFQAAPASVQNQLNGFCNDSAGNLILNTPCPQPPFTPTYYYDDENRLIATAGDSYIYDGDGQRVEKCTEGTPGACATSATGTLYWKGSASAPLTETDLSGTNQKTTYIFFNGQRVARSDSAGAIHYYFSDHLGSHGVVENATGSACEQDIDYYPYGGVENDYCPNVAQNYKFTGKERDSESGLDNFGARYNASTMGRFMSPDPLGGHQEDPQTLNRYSYVRNNPLSLTDPTGLDFYLNCSQDSSTCQGGHVGTTTTTTDANGNTTSAFTATVVTSASLQDPNSGNTATVNENGVQITTGGQSYQGTFISNTPAADVQGSGQLQDFSFHINGNCGGSCFTSGEWSYNGTLNQARALLYDRGSFTIPFEDSRAGLGLGAHPFSTQHRFGGSDCTFLSCANSPHLSVAYDPGSNHYVAADDVAAAKLEPKANVPSTGGFHVDAHADWIGHAQDVSNAPPH